MPKNKTSKEGAEAPKKGGAHKAVEIDPQFNGLFHTDPEFGLWSVVHGAYSRYLPKRAELMPKATNQLASYAGYFAIHKSTPQKLVCQVWVGEKKLCGAELNYKGPENNSNVVAHVQSAHPNLLMYEEVAARKLHPTNLVVAKSEGSGQQIVSTYKFSRL